MCCPALGRTLQNKLEKIMENILPIEFQLSQNYPNPFKKRTTIRYSVPYKARIGIEVYDSFRNKVKTLIKEIKEAGTYKVEIDAAVLPSVLPAPTWIPGVIPFN